MKRKFKFERIKTKKGLDSKVKLLRQSKHQAIITLLCINLTKDWDALGYDSFKDFVEKRLPEFQYDTVLAWVTCAKITFNVAGINAVGRYSMNATREFKSLDKDQQKQLWAYMKESAQEAGHNKIEPKWLTASRVIEHREQLFGHSTKQSVNLHSDMEAFQQVEGASSNFVGSGKSNISSTLNDELDFKQEESKKGIVTESSNIKINSANKKVVLRSRLCEELLDVLEAFDCSKSLARTVSNFSVASFDIKTLKHMTSYINKEIITKTKVPKTARKRRVA